MRNLSYNANFFIFHFLGHFWRENEPGHHASPYGLGTQNPTKKMDHCIGRTIWANHYLESMFSQFLGATSPLDAMGSSLSINPGAQFPVHLS